jgi:hypothetical protein
MSANQTSSKVIRFRVFEVDFRANELSRNGTRIRLRGQPFPVLAMLLERPGDIATSVCPPLPLYSLYAMRLPDRVPVALEDVLILCQAPILIQTRMSHNDPIKWIPGPRLLASAGEHFLEGFVANGQSYLPAEIFNDLVRRRSDAMAFPQIVKFKHHHRRHQELFSIE